jgi:hypothetical protein
LYFGGLVGRSRSVALRGKREVFNYFPRSLPIGTSSSGFSFGMGSRSNKFRTSLGSSKLSRADFSSILDLVIAVLADGAIAGLAGWGERPLALTGDGASGFGSGLGAGLASRVVDLGTIALAGWGLAALPGMGWAAGLVTIDLAVAGLSRYFFK